MSTFPDGRSMIGRAAVLAGAATRLARRRAAPGGVVLGYHDVVASGADGLSVTASDLRRHVRLLRRLGLDLVRAGEMVEALESGASIDGKAALTFDDGLVGVHEHAVEVLAEEGAPATLCAVSASWGRAPVWWPGSRRVMTRDEVDDVVDAGWEIAAHTRTHRSLPGLSDPELARELRGCREELEDIAGAPVTTLAYPDGHHDDRVREAARSAGYRAGFTFLNGRLTGREDRWRLPRLTMTAAHSSARLGYHLTRSAASWPAHQQPAVGPSAVAASD